VEAGKYIRVIGPWKQDILDLPLNNKFNLLSLLLSAIICLLNAFTPPPLLGTFHQSAHTDVVNVKYSICQKGGQRDVAASIIRVRCVSLF
jgi:hypothetical protein